MCILAYDRHGPFVSEVHAHRATSEDSSIRIRHAEYRKINRSLFTPYVVVSICVCLRIEDTCTMMASPARIISYELVLLLFPARPDPARTTWAGSCIFKGHPHAHFHLTSYTFPRTLKTSQLFGSLIWPLEDHLQVPALQQHMLFFLCSTFL